MVNDARQRIVTVSWELFKRVGYRRTTVDDIITKAGVAKGTFYHHFRGKSSLLSTLSDLLDDKYRELDTQLVPEDPSIDKIVFLNRELFDFVEKDVPVDLLSALLASQLNERGDRSLMDQDRYYFAIHRRLVSEGQARGEIVRTISAHDVVRLYTMGERSMLYDWCIHQGSQPLVGEPTDIMESIIRRFAV